MSEKRNLSIPDFEEGHLDQSFFESLKFQIEKLQYDYLDDENKRHVLNTMLNDVNRAIRKIRENKLSQDSLHFYLEEVILVLQDRLRELN